VIIYPAIDLRHGRVVRLQYGDPSRETVHSDDPLATAERWQAAGARWLHVINLDGALGEATLALETLRALAGVGLSIQFGGGLRTLDNVQKALDAGAARVILGTMVVKEPELAGAAVERFGAEKVVVALDAKGDQVATHGWQQVSAWTPVELGKRFAAMGVIHALYTDVSRDGDLSGVNVAATANLARETGLCVIASGGVASLDDVRRCRETGLIAGVVIGKALYSGAFALEEAIKIAERENMAEKTLLGKNFTISIYTGWDELKSNDNNLDVHVFLDSGEHYVATFFTLENLKTLMTHYETSGECNSGQYFCDSDMIIVRQITEKVLLETVQDMLDHNELDWAFSLVEDDD
jgi:phosphoribosylformimino-5-aminoimidazole carboxamide ribotide isomerase